MGKKARVSYLWAALGLTASLVSTTPALSMEAGISPWLKGFNGFMSGVLPPEPASYGTSYYYFLNGSAGKQVRNGRVELNIDTTLNAGFLENTVVTDVNFLGGQYAFGVLVGWAGDKLSSTITLPTTPLTPNGGQSVSFGNNDVTDTIITPLILGWHDGVFNWNIAANVYIPTGGYHLYQLNIGKNIWAFMPALSFTYFDPQTGWDVSGSFVFITMSNNRATDYHSGDIVQLDWAAGKHFGEGGAWEAGIGGNVVQQVAGDTGNGAKLGPFKEESVGLGPAVSYNTKLGALPVIVSTKWEHDLVTHNTFKGNVVTASATVVF